MGRQLSPLLLVKAVEVAPSHVCASEVEFGSVRRSARVHECVGAWVSRCVSARVLCACMLACVRACVHAYVCASVRACM